MKLYCISGRSPMTRFFIKILKFASHFSRKYRIFSAKGASDPTLLDSLTAFPRNGYFQVEDEVWFVRLIEKMGLRHLYLDHLGMTYATDSKNDNGLGWGMVVPSDRIVPCVDVSTDAKSVYEEYGLDATLSINVPWMDSHGWKIIRLGLPENIGLGSFLNTVQSSVSETAKLDSLFYHGLMAYEHSQNSLLMEGNVNFGTEDISTRVQLFWRNDLDPWELMKSSFSLCSQDGVVFVGEGVLVSVYDRYEQGVNIAVRDEESYEIMIQSLISNGFSQDEDNDQYFYYERQ